jgi:hypothetical protein
VYQSEKYDVHLRNLRWRFSYWCYLRFYEDGTVLAVISEGTPVEIARWFNRQHYSSDKGTYSLDGNHITFSATSAEGTVDYDGTVVEGGKLKLKKYSHIIDYRSTETYWFVQEEPSWGKPDESDGDQASKPASKRSPWLGTIESEPSQLERRPSRLEKRVGQPVEPTTRMRSLGNHLMVDEHGIIWGGGRPVGVWGVNPGH